MNPSGTNDVTNLRFPVEALRLSVGDCYVFCVDVSQSVKSQLASGFSTLRSTATEEDWLLRRSRLRNNILARFEEIDRQTLISGVQKKMPAPEVFCTVGSPVLKTPYADSRTRKISIGKSYTVFLRAFIFDAWVIQELPSPQRQVTE